jgi:Na+/H+-dicarboxylate symporter
MIAWWWILIAMGAGYVLGYFVTSIATASKVLEMMKEQQKMSKDFDAEWNKWGRRR